MYAVKIIMTINPRTVAGRLAEVSASSCLWGHGTIPKTAMILNTSTAPIGGLRGSKTKVGVKKTLIHRKDHPA